MRKGFGPDVLMRARKLIVFCIFFTSKCSGCPVKLEYLKACRFHSHGDIII